VRKHVARQLDAFEQHWGHAPDHIDGHQHVHQFPVIRDVLLAECKRRYAHQMPWLRWSQPLRATSNLKRQFIAAWGAEPVAQLAREMRMPLSGPLLGVYGFDPDDGVYSTHMHDWLAHAETGCLLMCHPAAGDDPADIINPARQREYAYLGGPRFAQDLADAGCEVVRGTALYRDFSCVEGVQA
jgi:chitin disaccharide deacetylase